MLATALLLATPRTTLAQHDLGDFGRFLAGAAFAFGVHEGAHMTADLAFGATPGVRRVSLGPVPFFAITHDPVSRGREFTISSAGFWAQEASSEIILSRMPRLRESHAPLLKGMLAFNVLTSVGYAAAAIARAGPAERDTRGMAMAADISEPAVGFIVLTPAVLDALRYYFPGHAWLRWASRASKAGGVLFVIRAAD